ncbi:MAG: DUF4139 domain-containing protein [candidate division WOR-3 bacterium]
MKGIRFIFFFFLLAKTQGEVQLTVYNQNLGLVREERKINLRAGIQEVKFTDVAANIDATSVHFQSLTAPNEAVVLEQNFEYDLISRDKLLEKYIDKEIEILRRFGVSGEKSEVLKGKLLSTKGGLTVKVGDQIYLNPSGEIILSKLPEGLVTKPTLSWLIDCTKSGEHKVEVSYLTSGINWNADYVVVSDKDDKSISLNGWVTIENKSGATYQDAKLKLIAGDIHRVSPPSAVREYDLYAERKALAAPQFEEKPFFEYHMYTLQRKTTIRDNETKQIEFASASHVPVKKLFIYDGARMPFYGYSEYSRADQRYGTQSQKKVYVMLEFKNTKENNLGIPLPKGKMRVYKEDTDKSLQFIGEDWIDHTPKDEIVRIYLGDAFDLVGERVQTDFKMGGDWVLESYKITIRNHKEEPVTVRVVEHLYRWSNWKIVEKSQDYEKKDSRTIEFNLPVPKNGEGVITYTVRYWW